MAVVGHVHKITNQTKFFSAVLLNQEPPETSFGSIGPVEVELITRIGPANLPLVLSQIHSSADGGFAFDHPELIPTAEKLATLQLVVRKPGDTALPADWGFGAPINVFDSIYRSAEFKMKDAGGKQIDIFVAFDTTPKDKAVAGPTVDQAVSSIISAMNADPKLDSRLRPVDGFAFIWNDGVNMHLSTGSGPATTISDFRFALVSSESPDLAEFFDPYIVDFRSQHSCLVSDDYVKTMLQQGVDNAIGVLNATIQKTLVADLAFETGQQPATVQNFLDSSISTTFRRVRYPRIGEHITKTPIGGDVDLPDFGIAPDPCFGFPRVLFGS